MEIGKQTVYNKLMAVMLLVVAIITIFIFHVNYKHFTATGTFLEPSSCKLIVEDKYKLEGTGSFGDVGLKISEAENYQEGTLRYTQLKNFNECGGTLGLWFDANEEKFIYCLTTRDVVKLGQTGCKKLGPWGLIKSIF